jgi:hypothetical protein
VAVSVGNCGSADPASSRRIPKAGSAVRTFGSVRISAADTGRSADGRSQPAFLRRRPIGGALLFAL